MVQGFILGFRGLGFRALGFGASEVNGLRLSIVGLGVWGFRVAGSRVLGFDGLVTIKDNKDHIRVLLYPYYTPKTLNPEVLPENDP